MTGLELVQVWTKRILIAGTLVLGTFYLAGMVWLFSQRLGYPYEIDWVEGAMLTSVLEILKGGSLYVEPTIAYVPLVYGPVYFHISALFAQVFGAGLLALRLVSILASLVSVVMIVLIVFRETNSWFWGFVSAGFFAGLYPASRYWFDLARVDSLFLMFFLIFLYALRRGDSVRWQICAGIFASLAALTKQSGLTMCLPVIGVYFLLDWKHRLALPLTTLLVYGGVSLGYILSSHGWYTYYCYVLLLLEPDNEVILTVFDFVREFIIPNILIATLLTIIVFSVWFFQSSKERLILWSIIFATTIVTSFLGKSKVGGVNNALIPTFAIFAIFMGIAIPELSKTIQSWSKRYYRFAEITLCLLVVFQMTQVIYKPWRHTPPSEDYKDGAKALQLVKRFDGNVYAPNSAILLLAGKSTFAHPSAVWEVVHSLGDSQGKDLLKADIQKAIDTRLFDAVIVFSYIDFFPGLQEQYDLDGSKYILVDDNWKEKADVYVLP